MGDDVVAFEDELVDLDVVELNRLGDDVPGLVNVEVVEDADVLEEVLVDLVEFNELVEFELKVNELVELGQLLSQMDVEVDASVMIVVVILEDVDDDEL
eukprot:4597663-Amphidinium_carterae.1